MRRYPPAVHEKRVDGIGARAARPSFPEKRAMEIPNGRVDSHHLRRFCARIVGRLRFANPPYSRHCLTVPASLPVVFSLCHTPVVAAMHLLAIAADLRDGD